MSEIAPGMNVWWSDTSGHKHVGQVIEVRGNRVTVQVGPVKKHKRLVDVHPWRTRA